MRKVLLVFLFALAPAIAQAQQAESPAPPAECCAAQTAAKACAQCQAATAQVAVKACTACQAKGETIATKACSACQAATTKVAATACTACQNSATVAKVEDACCCSSSQQVVMYSFSAPWCGPCQEMKKTLADADVAKSLTTCKVIKVNIDEQPETAARFEINAIPAQVFVSSDGKVIKKIVGLQQKDQLIAAVKQVAPQHVTATQAAVCTVTAPTITMRKQVEGGIAMRTQIQASGDHNIVTVMIGDKPYRIKASKIEIEEKNGVIRLQCEGAKLTSPTVTTRVIRKVEAQPGNAVYEVKSDVIKAKKIEAKNVHGGTIEVKVKTDSTPPMEKPHTAKDASGNVFFWQPAQGVTEFVQGTETGSAHCESESCDDVLVQHGLLKNAPGNQTVVIRVRNVPAIDIAKSISAFLNTERDLHVGHIHCESEQKVTVVPEPITNSLIVTAGKDHLENVKTVAKVLDQCKPACPTEEGVACTKPIHEIHCAGTQAGLTSSPATECPAGVCTECPDAGNCPVCPALKANVVRAETEFHAHVLSDVTRPHPPHAVMAAPVSLFNPFVAKSSQAAPAKGSYCVVTTQGERHAYAGEFVRMNEEFIIVKENGTTHWIPRHSVECLSVKEEQVAEAPRHPATAMRQVFPHPVALPYPGAVHPVLPSPPVQALPPAQAPSPSSYAPMPYAPSPYAPAPPKSVKPAQDLPAPVSYAVPAKSMFHIEMQVSDGDDVISSPHLMTLEHQRASVQVGSTNGPCFYAGVEVQAVPDCPDAFAVNMFNAAGIDKPCLQTVCKSGEGVQVPWQVGDQTFEVTMMVRKHQGDKSCCQAATPKFQQEHMQAQQQAVQMSFESQAPQRKK